MDNKFVWLFYNFSFELTFYLSVYALILGAIVGCVLARKVLSSFSQPVLSHAHDYSSSIFGLIPIVGYLMCRRTHCDRDGQRQKFVFLVEILSAATFCSIVFWQGPILHWDTILRWVLFGAIIVYIVAVNAVAHVISNKIILFFIVLRFAWICFAFFVYYAQHIFADGENISVVFQEMMLNFYPWFSQDIVLVARMLSFGIFSVILILVSVTKRFTGLDASVYKIMKFLAATALWLDWQQMLFAFLASVMMCSLYCVIKKKKVAEIDFLLFIALGSILSVSFGRPLLLWCNGFYSM